MKHLHKLPNIKRYIKKAAALSDNPETWIITTKIRKYYEAHPET